MPKQTGLGDNFYVGGYDLSGDVASVDQISAPMTPIDVTSLTFKAPQRLGGRRDGNISFTTFLDINVPTVSTPAVPASGTPYINAFPYPVHITITGGTMTNVVINGVSVGSGASTYTLPVNGSITPTYTVAPTWSFFVWGTEHNALASIPSADVAVSYFQGTTIGNPAASMVSKQTNYDPTRSADASITLKVDAQANSFGVEWGRQLTGGLRTDNGPVTGPFYDHGVPPGAWGCQAYLHLVELVGTNVQVTITHCATSGGSYTTLIDFGSLTAIGDKRIATANTVTVNQFLKVVSAGTFTQAVFGVNFVRNPAAGVA